MYTPVRGGSITAAIIEISSGRGRAPREINPDLLSEKSRKAHLVEARSLFCFRAARHLGYAATATASFLRMTRPGAGCAADRGEAIARAKGFVLGEAKLSHLFAYGRPLVAPLRVRSTTWFLPNSPRHTGDVYATRSPRGMGPSSKRASQGEFIPIPYPSKQSAV